MYLKFFFIFFLQFGNMSCCGGIALTQGGGLKSSSQIPIHAVRKMYPELSGERSSTETTIVGLVATKARKLFSELSGERTSTETTIVGFAPPKSRKLFSELSGERTSTETTIVGFAPTKPYYEGSETSVGAENEGCKCGADCTGDPCP